MLHIQITIRESDAPSHTSPIEEALRQHFTFDPMGTAHTSTRTVLDTLRAHGITNPFAIARAAHQIGWMKDCRGYRGVRTLSATPERRAK